MNCNDTQQRLSAMADGSLDESETVVVAEHLQMCDVCRSEADQLRQVHADLSRLLAADQTRAEDVADRVLDEWSAANPPQESPIPIASWTGTIIGYLLAAAAGFVIAMLWFRTTGSKNDASTSFPTAGEMVVPREVITVDNGTEEEILVSPAAHLVAATGEVWFRPPADDDWTSIDTAQLATFACPTSARVKTESGVLCELQTTTGSKVRLNESSEIALRSEEELELIRGQIWCQSADGCELRVYTVEGGAGEPTSSAEWMLACQTSSELMTSCEPSQPLQVVAAAGNVDVRTQGTLQNLQPGSFYTVADGEVKVWQQSGDVLAAERWMQPLLVLSGHGNPELTRRVDALLAQIGRTKLSHSYEQDLRNLGEYGALPLLKFTLADESADEPHRRRTAMQIVADTAPVWMVPDLIELLEDEDPEIRSSAARGLQRLTGMTHGLSPEDWSSDREQLTKTVQLWRDWWGENRFCCPAPPAK